MRRVFALVAAATATWLGLPLLAVLAVAFSEPGPEGAIGRFGSLEGFRELGALDVSGALVPSAAAAALGSVLACSFAVSVATASRFLTIRPRRLVVALMAIPMLTSVVPRTLAILNVVATPGRVAELWVVDLGLTANAVHAGTLIDVATVAIGFGYTYSPYLFFLFWVAMEGISDGQLDAARDAGAATVDVARYLLLASTRRLLAGVWFVSCVLMSLDLVVPRLFGDGKVLYIGPAIEIVFLRLRNRPAAVAFMIVSVLAAVFSAAALLGIFAAVRRTWQQVYGALPGVR